MHIETKYRSDPDQERGASLIVVLLVMVIVAGLGASLAQSARVDMEVVGNYRGLSRAFFAADGITVATANEIVMETSRRGRFPNAAELATLVPPSLDGVALETLTISPIGTQVNEPLQNGFYQGLIALSQEYSVDVTAATTGWPVGRSSVGMDVIVDMIPLFQFMAFYEDDLEILPGPSMTLTGRVHSNSDIYLNSDNTLRIDSTVTSAASVFHGRKDRSASLGDVEIRSADGWEEMDGMDSDHADWTNEALERWDGNVRSAAHGVERLNLAIANPDDPRMIIERGISADSALDRESKLYYSADVRILNGRAYDPDGNVLSTIDPVTGQDALRPTILYDQREEKHMLTMEIDMEKLGRSPAFPANGLLYVGSYEGVDLMPSWSSECGGCFGPDEWDGYAAPWNTPNTEFAVKLAEADELPAPMTIVSDNPTYIRGHFNRTNKKGAAVLADAVTVLSEDWGRLGGPGDPDDDLTYSEQSLWNRDASATEVYAALMLGSFETAWGDYGGGLENVIRFLEDWSGTVFTYRGSLVSLWFSESAEGDWIYGWPIYTAPSRDYDFDSDFMDANNLPPFAPSVMSIRATDWRRE